MPTYRVIHGKHTLWEGDKESGEHVDVGLGDEFTIARLPPVLLPFVEKVTTTAPKKTKKRTTVKGEEEEADAGNEGEPADE